MPGDSSFQPACLLLCGFFLPSALFLNHYSRVPSTPPRYHHLDALRGTAMLLGIVLHGLLSFWHNPFWPAQDVQQHDFYGTAGFAIHGFRLPLFFLVSGYFTTMLWRRRGLGELIIHRLQRILLPLVVGWFAFVPLTFVISLAGEHINNQRALQAYESDSEPDSESNSKTEEVPDLWLSIRSGDTTKLRTILARGIDPDAKDPYDIPALHWAVLADQPACTEILLAGGADPDNIDGRGNTALHAAAFYGRIDHARLLVDYGADVNFVSIEGRAPLDSARIDWELVETVSKLLRVEATREEVMAGRKVVVAYLREEGATVQGNALVQLYRVGAMFPLTFHLWFLYYLLMLVAIFVLVSLLVTGLKIPSPPGWLLSAPTCLLYLVPLTALAQYFQHQSFGADTAMGLLPWPPKLFYYLVFFGFGAICYGRREFEEKLGRWWPLFFLLAVPLFLYGFHLFEERPSGLSRWAFSFSATLYAWLMVFGFLGVFRRFFARESPRLRYVSDASYWIYLAHLPLVLVLQILVSTIPLPGPLKFSLIIAITFSLLLISYRYLVRYSFIGTMLNGKRVRPSDAPPPLPASTP